MKKTAMILLISIILLNVCAVFIELVWRQNFYYGFFNWDVYALGYMPYWLLANLVLVVINGIGLLANSAISADKTWAGGFSARLPFTSSKLVGYNLVVIPLLVLFPRVVEYIRF